MKTAQETQVKVLAIQALDFSQIRAKLMVKNRWSEETAQIVEKWYKRFLILRLKYPSQSLVPSQMIDQMWHAHILDTRRYAEDCQNIFGKFMHHVPNYGNKKDLSLTFSETNALYVQEFGEDLNDMMAICQDESGDLIQTDQYKPVTDNAFVVYAECEDTEGGQADQN